MAISVFPQPSAATAEDNWVQIATATPTTGSVVSFTSIPTNYKKLWLVSGGILPSNSTGVSTTINSITGANDYRFMRGGPTATSYIAYRTVAGISGGTASLITLNTIFNNPSFGLPFVTFNGWQGDSTSAGVDIRNGFVITATTAISTIDITISSADFTTNTGTIYLYGTE